MEKLDNMFFFFFKKKVQVKLNLFEKFEFKNLWKKGEDWSLQEGF